MILALFEQLLLLQQSSSPIEGEHLHSNHFASKYTCKTLFSVDEDEYIPQQKRNEVSSDHFTFCYLTALGTDFTLQMLEN